MFVGSLGPVSWGSQQFHVNTKSFELFKLKLEDLFEDLVMVGTLAGEGLKGSGFGFSSFNRDFVDAPNIEAVEKDNADKLVASPYVPNVASPGPDGQVDNVVIPQKTAGGDFVGDSLLSPQKASADISTLTLGSLGLDTSSPKGK